MEKRCKPGSWESIVFLTGFSLFVLCCLPIHAFAGAVPEGVKISASYAPGPGAPIGKVRRVYGKALLMHADKKAAYRLRKGMAVYQGDILVTRGDGRISVVLNDESILTLGPKTELVLNSSVFEPDAGRRSVLLNMLFGKARFFVKKFASFKNSMFKVYTSTSVAAVRGSDFIIEQVGDKTVITTLGLTVLEVSNPNNPLARPVVVHSFEQLTVALNQLPGKPVKVSEFEIRKIMSDLIFPAGGEEGGAPEGEGAPQGEGTPLDNFRLPNQPPSFPEPTRPASPSAP